MNNPFQMFTHPQFGKIRVGVFDSIPYFIGKDVASALGYRDTDKAIRKHVSERDKAIRQIGGSRMIIISESGFYSLVLSSKVPLAQEFKRWVTSEVLPSIRKTGSYALPTVPEENELRKSVMRLKKQLTIAESFELAVVYLLLMSDGSVKIGFTKDLTTRIQQIQTQTCLEVLNYKSTPFMSVDDARRLEALLKEKYAPYQIEGEFFDVKFIDLCKELA